VIPWVLLDTASVPGGNAELRLMQRGHEFSIKLGQNELMSNRLSGSEEALATLAWHRIKARPQPRLLIGGLGMGFTLRAALAVMSAEARATVVELVPAIIAWARGPMADMFGDCLSDPRVEVREADVAQSIAAAKSIYDAILLDVDNGPEGLTRQSNDVLYDLQGLRAAHTALKSGGVLAVWSSGPDPKFTERLRKTGFDAEEINIRATGKKGGARHVIWMATRRD
jgi:spermidine synthase